MLSQFWTSLLPEEIANSGQRTLVGYLQLRGDPRPRVDTRLAGEEANSPHLGESQAHRKNLRE
jgi:hypothetical protein